MEGKKIYIYMRVDYIRSFFLHFRFFERKKRKKYCLWCSNVKKIQAEDEFLFSLRFFTCQSAKKRTRAKNSLEKGKTREQNEGRKRFIRFWSFELIREKQAGLPGNKNFFFNFWFTRYCSDYRASWFFLGNCKSKTNSTKCSFFVTNS